jgi:transposase-like protein
VKNKRTEEQNHRFDLLKRDLVHLMHTRGLSQMLEALIEIFSEWAEKHGEHYQTRLVEDLRRTLDRYQQRYEL